MTEQRERDAMWSIANEQDLRAEIAAKDAEIARLNEENAALRESYPARMQRLPQRLLCHKITLKEVEIRRLKVRVQSLLMRHNANHGDGGHR